MVETIWFAVHIRPQARTVKGEKWRKDPASAPFLIEARLQHLGFDTFLPRRVVFRFSNGSAYIRGRKREVPVELLPGWMFVGWPAGENRWHDLFGVPGVIGVAGFGGRPAPIADGAIRRLSERFRGGLIRAHEREQHMRTHAEYAPGDVVRMMAEPLAGFVGRVVSVRRRKARIVLQMLGHHREVEVDTLSLEAAPDEQAA